MFVKIFNFYSSTTPQPQPVSRSFQFFTSSSLFWLKQNYLLRSLLHKFDTASIGLIALLLVMVSGLTMANETTQIDQAQAISMVKDNPALLDTPEAQTALTEQGLTSNDVLIQINDSTTDGITAVSPIITEEMANDITTSDDIVAPEEEQEESKIRAIENYYNPLAYRSNADLLSEIKSQQSLSEDDVTERFSKVFFINKNLQDPGSLPVPDYYVVSNGDELSIWVYGVNEEVISVSVDSYGNLNIPVIGPVNVAGLAFVDVKKLISSKLENSYPDSSIIVNITKYSTIQVVMTGNVNAPGIYNVSALSTVKDLLIYAGGVKPNGTVRSIILNRADASSHELDLYQLLLGKNSNNNLFLKSGDVIIITNAHKLVSISGAVNVPATYELKSGENLDKLLDFAGGIRTDGSHYGLKVSGFDKEQAQVRMVDASTAAMFNLNDRDKVYVYPIEQININAISIFGNVVRPGEREIGKNASLAKLINSEVDKLGLDGVFLNNTLFNFAMIKRKTDTLGSEFVRLNLASLMAGTTDEVLRAGDELYVFNKLDTQLNPWVVIGGDVVSQPGRFQFVDGMNVSDLIQIAGVKGPYDGDKIALLTWGEAASSTDGLTPRVLILNEAQARIRKLSAFDEVQLYPNNNLGEVTIDGSIINPKTIVLGQGMTLKDLILAAGGLTEDVYYDHLRVTRVHNVDGKKFENQEMNLSLVDILNNGESNIALQDKDQVYIYGIDEMSIREKVVLGGQVRKPGEFFIGQGMNLKDLILAAGGYTDQAYLDSAEVIRYLVVNGQRTKEIISINLEIDEDFVLNNYDEITIKKIPNWYDKKTVTLTGQLKFPGTYTINDGDRLSDIVVRAGGFTDNAFLYGASFNRVSVKEIQQQALDNAVLKLKKKITLLSTQPKKVGGGEVDQGQLSETLAFLNEQGSGLTPLGRVTINLSSDINTFRGASHDIVLKDGDTLNVPTLNDTVMVIGEVMSPTAVIYDDDDVMSYIDLVGGLTPIGDDGQIYVVHANGIAERFEASLFLSSQVRVRPGDVIMVPQQLMIGSSMQMAQDISSLLYQFAITAASLKTVGLFN